MTLVDAYLSAVKSMEGRKPLPLQPFAAFVAAQGDAPTTDVSLAALREHLSFASGDDPLRKEMHLAIAGWDSATSGEWLEATEPHSSDRRTLVERLLGLDEETASAFDATFPLTGDGSVVISEEFEPWYTPERRAAHEFYWRAYKRHLRDGSGWNGDALTKLDTATTRVVERLSDPTRAQAYQSKGLVVGYVQSGKTANFTGVLAKSIDAGYRLVIVLTGTIDLLRKQTQRRLDMELVGIENIFLGIDPDDVDLARNIDYFNDEDRVNGKFLAHGFQPSEQGFTDIVRLTRHGSDYRSLNAGITALELQKRNKQKPLFDPENLYATDARLAVVKKNASVLRRLVRDLKSIRSHLGEIPTLIIDDESDQASVNTSDPKKWAQGEVKRTAINKLISELLQLLPRAQYVGYTATPYANVFIDPSDTEDIFPKDFLISLDRPLDYMGVADFHDLDASPDDEKTVANSNEKCFVRDLRAAPGGPDADAELLGALDAFVLSGALKLFRQSKDPALRFRHHTMLVHESVKMDDHKTLAERVKTAWGRAGYMTPAGLGRLADLLNKDFRSVSTARAPELPFPDTFEELKPYVGQALSKVLESAGNPVLIVNGDKDIDQQNLDFEMRSIWRILVGGTKLSRGFTIEGLTVSYYRRRTKQADTLMQMGRWFGFRKGYRDLVRLYIGRAEPDGLRTIDLYQSFEAIVRDEEAFRSQLRRYAKLVDGRPQITPRDIPPLVSQHLPTIKPSSRNKMFNAELVLRRSPGEPVEPTAFPTDSGLIEANYQAMVPVLKAASESHELSFPAEPRPSGGVRPGGRFNALVGTLSAEAVLKALGSLHWLRDDYFEPDLAYVREISFDPVTEWVVIAPQQQGEARQLDGVGNRTVASRKRREGRGGLFGALSDPKHRPPAARVVGARPSWGDNYVDSLVSSSRGAMLIYPMVDEETDNDREIIVAFTLFAPLSAQPASGQVIQFRAKDNGRPRAAIVPTSKA
ncbi:Z1 domain-containing protein [Blastococcus sp. SYSU DS0539]